MRSKNTKPWRKIVAVISFLCIAYMWTEKDIFAMYATMPKDRVIPLIITTVLVSLIKVSILVVGSLILKWIVKKIKKKQDDSNALNNESHGCRSNQE